MMRLRKAKIKAKFHEANKKKAVDGMRILLLNRNTDRVSKGLGIMRLGIRNPTHPSE